MNQLHHTYVTPIAIFAKILCTSKLPEGKMTNVLTVVTLFNNVYTMHSFTGLYFNKHLRQLHNMKIEGDVPYRTGHYCCFCPLPKFVIKVGFHRFRVICILYYCPLSGQ